jgi:hypothetical protein
MDFVVPNNTDPDLNFFNDVNCRYYDCDLFNASMNFNKDKLLVIHQNIRSFNCNYDELTVYLSRLKTNIDILILSETWFSIDSVVELPGYKGYHIYREGRRGGGVSVYVGNYLKSSPIPELSFINNIAEFCSVKVELSHGEFINVLGYYRPPTNNNIEPFCNLLNNTILNTFSSSDLVVTAGDCNVDILNPNDNINNYLNIYQSLSFIPYIAIPTRIKDQSATCIDHIFSNILSNTVSGVLTSSVTDHFTTFICVYGKRSEGSFFVKRFRDHSNCNLVQLKNMLIAAFSEFNSFDTLDVNLRASIFNEILLNAYNTCCPIKQKTFTRSRLSKPWLTDELIRASDTKHLLFRLYRDGIVPFLEYNRFKNKFTSLLRISKRRYYVRLFDQCKSNMKDTWKNIKSILSKSRSNEIQKIEHNDMSINDPSIIASVFNSHFSTVGKKLQEGIPTVDVSPISYMGAPCADVMPVTPATDHEVTHMISNLVNKSCNIYSIPVFIIKFLSTELSPFISQLFNSSLLEGKFPDFMKIASVVPIFKAGDVCNINNYRPISILPLLSKLFEKLMKIRVMSFLNQHNILSNHQFGFRSGSSTSDAILEFLSYSYESLNFNKYLLTVLLDFSRAFDTIDHRILLSKLNHVGIRGSLLRWFSSYLSNRKQYVTIGSHSSQKTSVDVGVPQGSVLGPILFLIYINDMSNCSDVLNFVHFADDTTVFLNGSDLNILNAVVNRELVKTSTWLIANKLSLNINKTFYMIISHKPIFNLAINIGGHLISRAQTVKFLGIFIDEKLTFKAQIDFICRKASRSLGIMYKLSQFLPPSVILNLYYALLHPYFIYGITAWGSSSLVHINKVRSIQSRALKLLPIVNDKSNFISYDVLNIVLLYEYFSAVKFYNVFILGQHEHLLNCLLPLLPTHQYGTRHRENNNFNLPVCTKARYQRSFLFKSVKIWNCIPVLIRNCQGVTLFKKYLKNHFLSVQSSIILSN